MNKADAYRMKESGMDLEMTDDEKQFIANLCRFKGLYDVIAAIHDGIEEDIRRDINDGRLVDEQLANFEMALRHCKETVEAFS